MTGGASVLSTGLGGGGGSSDFVNWIRLPEQVFYQLGLGMVMD